VRSPVGYYQRGEAEKSGLSSLKLQPEEKVKLKEAGPYFSHKYLDFLSNMTLHPEEQVKLDFVPKGDEGMGEITCSIAGVWRETILYEVPILAICKSSARDRVRRGRDRRADLRS
jgi:nicotinate phosphoribosyltransferase